jgi:hypothetical protein
MEMAGASNPRGLKEKHTSRRRIVGTTCPDKNYLILISYLLYILLDPTFKPTK